MRDERIRALARQCSVSEPEYTDWAEAIRTGIRERDAEIAAWAKEHAQLIPNFDLQPPPNTAERGYLWADDLLAFLKEADDAR